MTLRIFTALPLSYGVKKKIAILEENIDKRLKKKLNWIPLDNLHLTILFLGQIRFDDYLKVERLFDEFLLERPELRKPLLLKIKKVDFGPPGKDLMIWLYIEKNERLVELKNLLEKKLDQEKIIYKRESRDFLPHINLCRLKTRIAQPIREELNWSVIFNRLVLYESFLKKSGAEYEARKIIEFNKNLKMD